MTLDFENSPTRDSSSITRANIVVNRGNPRSRLMIIGEAPGAKENDLCEAFVGRSGKMLDNLLIKNRIDPKDEVYICNAVKCRPPRNRRPTKSELKLAKPWLLKQIELVDPWIILLLGSTALEVLLEKKEAIGSMRGTWQSWNGRLVMAIFHPSYLLRNQSKKPGSPISLTNQDLSKVRVRLKKLSEAFAFSANSQTQ